MQIRELLPIIIPGVLLQVLIQAYFIKHCWGNEKLSGKAKLWYIIAILLINLPAAAFYLIRSRDGNTSYEYEFKEIDIDDNLKLGIFVLLVVAYEIFSLRIISDNVYNPHYLLIVSLISYCFILGLIWNLIVRESNAILDHMLPAAQLMLMIPVLYLDNTYNSSLLLLIVSAIILNKLPITFSKIYLIASFGAFLAGGTAKALRFHDSMGFNEIINYIYVNALVFILITAAFYSLKKQLINNIRLDKALRIVKDQTEQIKEMSAASERNRITGEIHDTVGHTLASALISIEAAEELLGPAGGEAAEKLYLAKDQVKRGLNDIRSSIRSIRAGDDEPFDVSLCRMLDEVRQTTNIEVNCIVELKTELLSVQRGILLLAIKECTTNALKHGKCSEIDVLVQESKGEVKLTFSDNGKGSSSITPGSGLTIMRERIQGIGGTLGMSTSPGEGFTVNIAIPV
ncbi:sensor histidine kinase [Gudongella oleilytica]|uniref:sensor histidine kinase n=1 Tax=Gudongella oleilytica TaxID=1582259 RepID=UPI000FF89D47|nr:sensor histidine kinase [Gudongella oleilytica]